MSASSKKEASSEAVQGSSETTKSRTPVPITLAIVFSSGDLGDVGRHAVAAALEMGDAVAKVRVLSNRLDLLDEPKWKCACPHPHVPSESDRRKLELIHVNVTSPQANLAQHLQGVHAVISCLGNRKPFHPDCIAKVGTQRIVDAMAQQGNAKRLVLLSSAGIADDWPPIEWSRDGLRLQGFFRTVCWKQYQDLSGAEMAVRQGAENSPGLDFLMVRAVHLTETAKPTGDWYVQKVKHQDHPTSEMAKMDCGRFMVQQCLHPTLHRTAVVVGGAPEPSNQPSAPDSSKQPSTLEPTAPTEPPRPFRSRSDNTASRPLGGNGKDVDQRMHSA